MKRFYKLVSTQRQSGGFSICLDGKPMKTPMGATLLAENEKIADELVREWAAQKDKIDPESMPLTQIITTKIDRVEREREAMETALMKYLNTDLLCYRADEKKIAKKQALLWDPPLAWFKKHFGAALETTTDLKALTQPPQAHQAVEKYIGQLNDDVFAILQLVTALGGSVVLGLAFIAHEIDADIVYDAAHVEESHKAEIYNEKLYGAAPHEEKSRAAMRRDLAAAEQYRDLLSDL
jgi:chaperone required for assembly of F1-ATPase